MRYRSHLRHGIKPWARIAGDREPISGGRVAPRKNKIMITETTLKTRLLYMKTQRPFGMQSSKGTSNPWHGWRSRSLAFEDRCFCIGAEQVSRKESRKGTRIGESNVIIVNCKAIGAGPVSLIRSLVKDTEHLARTRPAPRRATRRAPAAGGALRPAPPSAAEVEG